MNADVLEIKSDSVGDPARFHSLDHLERAMAALPAAPRESGRVVLIVRRTEGGRRELPDRVLVTPDSGIPGDAWGRQGDPHPDAQLAVIQFDIAELIANGQPLPLFGDNLYLDLDLSKTNLPAGSRLRVGHALMEVTPQPHNGCRKFRARFGADALEFASNPELRPRNLRGIYLRVVEPGEVAVGDTVQVVLRAGS
jgi:MOSC domain-containing protein YiiM